MFFRCPLNISAVWTSGKLNDRAKYGVFEMLLLEAEHTKMLSLGDSIVCIMEKKKTPGKSFLDTSDFVTVLSTIVSILFPELLLDHMHCIDSVGCVQYFESEIRFTGCKLYNK